MKTSIISENIVRYIFGSPIYTGSVVLHNKDIKDSSFDDIKYLSVKQNLDIEYILNKDDIVYGLGENVRGMNKRGWIYESFCSDEFSHTEDKRSLYGAHNFIIVYGEKTFGLFIDSPSKVTFDIGYTDKNKMTIISENKNFNLYIIEGHRLKDIAKNFRLLIGESYAPPKWAFGYGQSRWGYTTQDDIKKVISEYKKNDIPLDMLYLDIDYMEEFKDFTIDKNRFPAFDKMINQCKNIGVRLIPIIDAGVKIEKGYSVYEEGIKNNYFCIDKNNEPFTAAVWPGKVHFPDFLNPEVRKWFGSKYKFLTDKGIEGFWNDMNEPAIFYSEEGLKEAYKKAEELKEKNIAVYDYFELKDAFINMANSKKDYQSMFHKVDDKLISNYDIHNLYGFNMTKAAYEGLEEIDKNKRFLLFSRASTIGMHRYGGIWTGDSCSWFEHIELTINMLPSLNMCGFIFIGSDTGGFSQNVTGDLLIRWNELSVFTPLYRNHSALGSRNQEPYAFDNETTKIIRNLIRFRYSLIPYLYSEFMKSIKYNLMYFSPLTFEYDDKMLREVEDQLLVGESIMITPVYKQNKTGRYVYLPEDMLLVKQKGSEKNEFTVFKKGYNYLNYDIDEIAFFIRKDKIVPFKSNIDLDSKNELDLIAFVDKEAKYYFYDDDGISKDYKDNKNYGIVFTIQNINNNYKFEVDRKGECLLEKVKLRIFDQCGNEVNFERDIR